MELPVADASVVKGGISRYMRQGLLLGDPTAALADDHGEFRLPIQVLTLAGFEDRLKLAGERVGVNHEQGGLLRLLTVDPDHLHLLDLVLIIAPPPPDVLRTQPP